MRKQLKRKRRSCGLCDPYKLGMENRWKPREWARRKEDEVEMRRAAQGK